MSAHQGRIGEPNCGTGLRPPQNQSAPLAATGQDGKSLGGQPVHRPARLHLLREPGFRPPFFDTLFDRFGFCALAVRVEKRQFVTRRAKSLGQISPRRRIRLARPPQYLRRLTQLQATERPRPLRDRIPNHDATLFIVNEHIPATGPFRPFFCFSLRQSDIRVQTGQEKWGGSIRRLRFKIVSRSRWRSVTGNRNGTSWLNGVMPHKWCASIVSSSFSRCLPGT